MPPIIEAKKKFTTDKYIDQIHMVRELFHVGNRYFNELGIQNTNQAGPVDVANKSVAELINIFYNQLRALENIDTTQIRRGQNSVFNSGRQVEEKEAQIKTVTDELRRRHKEFKEHTSGGYNRTEGNIFEYISSIIDAYDDVQTVMNGIEKPFASDDELMPASDALVDYETAQEEFTEKLKAYNKVIIADTFKPEDLSEEVKSALNGSDWSPESIVDKADFGTLNRALQSQLEAELAAEFELEQKNKQAWDKIRESVANDKKKITDRKAEEVVQESKRHEALRRELESQGAVFYDIIHDEQLPKEKLDKLASNLDAVKNIDTEKISEQYRMNFEDIIKNKTNEELGQLSKKYTTDLDNAQKRLSNLKAELKLAKDATEVFEKTWEMFENDNNLEEDEEYKHLTEDANAIQEKIDGVSALSDTILVQGAQAITPQFLTDNNLNFTLPDQTARNKAVKAGVDAVYNQIGRGKFSWPQQGQDLNAAINTLNKIIVDDFQDLGWADYETFSNDEIKKPYEMSPELKAEFFDITSMITNLNVTGGGLKEFGGFNSGKNGKEEALLVAKLVKFKDDLRAFGKSINPAFEVEDVDKQARIFEMMEGMGRVMDVIDGVAANKKVMEGLNKITNALEPTEEELEIKSKVEEELDKRRETLERDLASKNDEKERWVNGFNRQRTQAHLKLLQNQNTVSDYNKKIEQAEKDIQYLEHTSEIFTTQKAQSDLAIKKSDAAEELHELQQRAKKEQEEHKNILSNIESKYNTEMKAYNDKMRPKLIEVKATLENKATVQKAKVSMLTGLKDKVAELGTAKAKLVRNANTLGEKHQTIANNKVSARANLTAEHSQSLKLMKARELAEFNRAAGTKRFRGNSDEFKRMTGAIQTYLNNQPEEPDTAMTVEQYEQSTSDARLRINEYIAAKDKNGGKKLTDIGQIRLDMAYKMLKMFDMKKDLIAKYQSAITNVDHTNPRKVQVKTEAEQLLLGKSNNVPQNEPSRERVYLQKPVDKNAVKQNVNEINNEGPEINNQNEPPVKKTNDAPVMGGL